MSDKKEQIEQKGEPGLPVKIPVSIVRWLAYSVTFSGALAVWYPRFVGWDGLVGTCLILGHFASQLNALIKK
jgi:hypothetical protein